MHLNKSFGCSVGKGNSIIQVSEPDDSTGQNKLVIMLVVLFIMMNIHIKLHTVIFSYEMVKADIIKLPEGVQALKQNCYKKFR